MLWKALMLSAILFAIVNRLALRSRNSVGAILAWCALFFVVQFNGLIALPPVLFQSLLIAGAALVWHISGRRRGAFLPLSLGATLVAYGLAGMLVYRVEREYERLRARYPYESLEGRLPISTSTKSPISLGSASAGRLSRLEQDLQHPMNSWRTSRLRLLHEAIVDQFVSSPGFGVARVVRPAEWNLKPWRSEDPAPLQPGTGFSAPWSPGAFQPVPHEQTDILDLLLDRSILGFVNLEGFGYVKDRSHVAGFQTHRFRELPVPEWTALTPRVTPSGSGLSGSASEQERWKLQSLELVSLLLQEEPRVYVSDRLPRMEPEHDTPTRPLDVFEQFALETLRRGEDLVTSQGSEGVRMLGAIRSTTQCLACHGGVRGDLLGAFSYSLTTWSQEDR
jgi:hypothetical protein